MKRTVLRSTAFVRDAKKLLKRQPQSAELIRTAVERLAEDAFDPRLETHKLRGELDGLWACSADYDLRIIFDFVQHEGAEAILLQTLGTHDQVY
jgi:addiction module RelE/StbE family toxin